MKESIVYYLIKIFAALIRRLPLSVSLKIGQALGTVAYFFLKKNRDLAYQNMKTAFADSMSPQEIKANVKKLFHNYGKNFIELLRLPLMNKQQFKEIVEVEGEEHVEGALEKGRGVILLAMHFGSWEIASLSCPLLGYPYKMMVRPQSKYTNLDDLLNSYRTCGGSVVITKGMGTRDLIKGLDRNEAIGMVVDQGGKDGILVPFFGRRASMSVGAIRLALKLGVPLCFSIIIRKNDSDHRLIFHRPLELDQTGNLENDIFTNVLKVVKQMEHYIRQYPSEYMWFYKIWKYSNESKILVLTDEKVGHQRQSQAVAVAAQKVLSQKNINASVVSVPITFKNRFSAKMFTVISFLGGAFFSRGSIKILKIFLTPESYRQIISSAADIVVSCGSSLGGINALLSCEYQSKNIVVLKPGLLGFRRFDCVVLPQHDIIQKESVPPNVILTKAALNLITPQYLQEQSRLLLNRFSHLKNRQRLTIGVFIGGDSKNVFISEQQIRVVVHQLKEVSREINADILLTSSRRTPNRMEQYLYKEFKKDSNCPLCILANRDNIPEAVGGILGISDIVVVSGDSISMISEAASSGKQTIVFLPQKKEIAFPRSHKHILFVEKLNEEGFILSSPAKNIGQSIYNIAKNKIVTRKIDDNQILVDELMSRL